MRNNKIFASLLVGSVIMAWVWSSFADFTWTTVFRNMSWLTTEQKAQFETVKTIIEKQKSWETLTADEQTKLTEFQANKKTWKGNWFHKWWEKWNRWGKMENLTDAEKTSLESMTQVEKKAFFEQKMQAQKLEMDAKDNVIDKLLAWETLTSDEQAIKQTIIKDRAERKVKQAEKLEIRTLMQKQKAWETLTQDEQSKLTEFQASHSFKHKR